MLSLAQLSWLALAGFGAGAVNALAGGGTLLSFPALLALGIAPVSANITSTVALCPGYLGAALAQRQDLRGQRARLAPLLAVAAAGGLIGAMLLLRTDARAFGRAVPWLILLACALLALQERVRAMLVARAGPAPPAGAAWTWPLVGAAAAYGGYFGAGMSVILLAALGIAYEDSLVRLNALKQWLALAANLTAACWLAWRAPPDWGAVAVLALSAALGGAWGGRMAGRLSPPVLRRAVIVLGIAIALAYFWRQR
ncbi:MAG TPA: sulfite exporter TauE/SafE family protein [Steroidobacteraceae bacterium]|nr:sulfite exporter TauE/SafE family protein [Steroidobacteraceae bacterium]